MITILHTFCVVACIISGIFGSIIYYYFRDAKRMIWFVALSFAFGLNLFFSPYLTADLVAKFYYESDLSDNLYLITLGLSIMCMSMYTSHSIQPKYVSANQFFSYSFLVLTCICIFLPAKFFNIIHTVFFFMQLAVYIFSLVMAKKEFEAQKKYRMYQIIAYSVMVLGAVSSLALFSLNLNYFLPRDFAIVFYLFMHAVMMTRRYRLSIQKTKRLTTSLSETIERINHSDNALMCTQMKADFLYRSLDLISQKCDEDPFVAEDLTVSLSKYLRHTLNFQQLKGIVPLSNEIELTKAFIAIEKERNPKITYQYRFPDPLPDFHIPPLSIQPIVENAINHGFSGDEEDPRITITIIPYRDYYHIDISDNGTGMDEATVQSLTETLHDSARVGIYSIHTRLINLFGKGLVIQSAPGVGTSVSFVVPPDAIAYLKEREKEDANE